MMEMPRYVHQIRLSCCTLILILILVLIIAIDRLVRRAQVQTPADQRKRPDQVGKLVFFSLSQSNFIDNKKTFLIVNKQFVGKQIIFLLLNRRCSHEANQNQEESCKGKEVITKYQNYRIITQSSHTHKIHHQETKDNFDNLGYNQHSEEESKGDGGPG